MQQAKPHISVLDHHFCAHAICRLYDLQIWALYWWMWWIWPV